jgi:hypothetical protein
MKMICARDSRAAFLQAHAILRIDQISKIYQDLEIDSPRTVMGLRMPYLFDDLIMLTRTSLATGLTGDPIAWFCCYE